MSAAPSIECPGCKSPNDTAANFCARCGNPLKAGLARPTTRPPAPPTGEMDFMLGRLIDARYRVLERVGQGGMGLVYKVEHQRMGKIAAMKILRRDLASDKEVVKRFRREAEAISKLTHPNTVQIFDFGAYDGVLYLVMEYVRGEDLGAVLAREGALSFRRGGPMFVQICGALAEAHELGIVHRDLKPENVIVTRTKDGGEHVKVLDFGLAKLSEREDAADVSSREAIVGTPYYMAPEQIRGELLDHRADIYAMGAMMYRLLTGEPPFTAATPVGVLTKHLTDDLVPVHVRAPSRQIDPRVSAIVGRAMAKPRDARYASVDELRAALAQLIADLSSEASGTRPGRLSAEQAQVAPVGPNLTPQRLPAVPAGRPGAISEELRLQRGDIDAFERGLRRRAVLRVLLPPLLAVGLGAGAYFGWTWWRAKPQRAEREPNESVGVATLIEPGRDVTGTIGKRQSESEGDVDVFRVPVPAGLTGPIRVRASVDAPRNLDLSLGLVDVAGRELAVADAFGVGVRERFEYTQMPSGDAAYVVVRESRTDPQSGQLSPTENVSDTYTLRVELLAFAPGEEREPNESDSEASELPAGGVGRGRLARPGDVDKWHVAVKGRVNVTVRGADEVPIRVRVGSDDATVARTLTLELPADAILSVERADEDNAPRKPLVGADSDYELRVDPAP